LPMYESYKAIVRNENTTFFIITCHMIMQKYIPLHTDFVTLTRIKEGKMKKVIVLLSFSVR
jgi:hypothetical protein